MVDVLTRLFRCLTWDTLPLLDDMLQSDDEACWRPPAPRLGDVKYLDKEQWATACVNLRTIRCPSSDGIWCQSARIH